MQRGARPVTLAPRPSHPPHPSPAVLERLAQMESWRRARAHRRSEMRRPLSERQAERAALAKAEMRARRKAAAARERRLECTKEAVEIWHHAKYLARQLMRGARSDATQVRFVKEGVRFFERQEMRRHCVMIHGHGRNCKCKSKWFDLIGGRISSYVYEEARVEEAKARESRKLALKARVFEREARDAVASGSSEALRRLWRVEGPHTVGPSVPASVIAERLKEWQQDKQVV